MFKIIYSLARTY